MIIVLYILKSNIVTSESSSSMYVSDVVESGQLNKLGFIFCIRSLCVRNYHLTFIIFGMNSHPCCLKVQIITDATLNSSRGEARLGCGGGSV